MHVNMKPQAVRYTPEHFFIHQPSQVDFYRSGNSVDVVIDDTWSVPLERRDQTVGQVNLGMEQEILKGRFMGGRYFIVDDQVIDWRDADHLNFIHTGDSIAKLVETIGFVGRRGHLIAGNVTHHLEYEAFATEGGQFNVEIGFNWSPFSIDINSELSIIRLLCENLMTASSPVMNHRIPMINTWEENLAISNQVIGHTFHKLVGPRLAQLVDERISVYDVVMMRAFLVDLANSKKADGRQLAGLNRILAQIEPIFTDEVNALQRNMQKFVPAPITGFDALNIATEVATHYVGEDRSAKKAIGFANNLIFDENRQRNMRTDLDKLVVDTRTFHCADQAFFGQTVH